MSKSEKGIIRGKVFECMNCGQKRFFNRGIYYAGTAANKLLKLSEIGKAPENKFYYFF